MGTILVLILGLSTHGYFSPISESANSDLYEPPITFLNGAHYFENFKPEGMWIGVYDSLVPTMETFVGECCLCTGESVCENGKFFYFTTDPHYYWEKAKEFCAEAGISDQLKSIQVKFLYTAVVRSEGDHSGERHDVIWELNMNEKGYWYTYAPFNSSVCSSPFCLLFRGDVDKSLAPPDAEYRVTCFSRSGSCFPCLKDMKCTIEEEGKRIVVNHCNNQCYAEEGICFACDSEDFTQHFVTHQSNMHGLVELSAKNFLRITPGESVEFPLHVTNHSKGAEKLVLELFKECPQGWDAVFCVSWEDSSTPERVYTTLDYCETEEVMVRVSVPLDAESWSTGKIVVRAFSVYHTVEMNRVKLLEVACLEISFEVFTSHVLFPNPAKIACTIW